MKPAKRALRLLFVIAAVVAALFLWRYFLSNRNGVRLTIDATGVVEATEVNISTKIPGRIKWLCCNEGDSLKAGQKALELDDEELRAKVREGSAAVQGAVESVREARANLDNAVTRSEAVRYDLEAAEAELRRYDTLVKEAGNDLDRANGLIKQGYITRKDMDSAETAYNAATASFESAAARKRSSEANLKNSLASIKAAKAGVSLASAGKDQLEARLKVLQVQLADTVVQSPLDGVVVYRAYETGEFVTPGTAIYTVDDMTNVWVRFDIEETELDRIRLGDRVEAAPIGSPGGKSYSGSITEIREAGSFATQRDVTRGRSDIRTFTVKARMASPEGYLKPRMTVEVKVYPGRNDSTVETGR